MVLAKRKLKTSKGVEQKIGAPGTPVPLPLEVLNRARSVTVGTAFGGITEISMRRHDGHNTYAILQPVEVVEIIRQLSASIGCDISVLPRKDFSSWRDWKYTEEELEHYRGVQALPGVGHPPHVNDMVDFMDKGASLPPPEKQPGLQTIQEIKEDEDETLAVKKHKDGRGSKRATKTT